MPDTNMETASGLLVLEGTSHFQTWGLPFILIFSAVYLTGEGAQLTIPCPDILKIGSTNAFQCEATHVTTDSYECVSHDVDFSLHVTEQGPGVWTTANNVSVCGAVVPMSGCLCVRQDGDTHIFTYSFMAYDIQRGVNLTCNVSEHSLAPHRYFSNVSCGSFIFDSDMTGEVKDYFKVLTGVVVGMTTNSDMTGEVKDYFKVVTGVVVGMTLGVGVIVAFILGCCSGRRRKREAEEKKKAGNSSVPMIRTEH